MITLDAPLVANQSTNDRRPIIKIDSCETVEAIPFVGSYLSTATINELYPEARVHSTGRLFVAYMVGPNASSIYTIRYGYSDPARTYFTWVEFPFASSWYVGGQVSICEMADSKILLVWTHTYAADGKRYTNYRILTVTGVEADPAVTGNIFNQASTVTYSGPFVTKFLDGTYIIVYSLYVSADAHYHFYKRTSADGITWSAASEITGMGINEADKVSNPYILIMASEQWLIFDRVVSVGPGGEELKNIWYGVSNDNFATIGAGSALTAYSAYDELAQHPVALQKSATEIYLVFDKYMSALHMDHDTSGWTTAASVSNAHINIASQKLYIINSHMGVGGKNFESVVKIDLATWTVDRIWTTSSVPVAVNSIAAVTSSMWNGACRGDGDYVPIALDNGCIQVINGLNNTNTIYSFYDFPTYGIAKTIAWTPIEGMYGINDMGIAKVWIDATTNRMYVALIRTYVWATALLIGYIDLLENKSLPDLYTFNVIVTEDDTIPEATLMGFRTDEGFMEINTTGNVIIVSMAGVASNWKGRLLVYDLGSGYKWKDYSVDTHPTFPYRGLGRGVYNAGVIMGSFTYEPLYGQINYRGACKIDLASDNITYYRPSWAAVDEYALGAVTLDDEGHYWFTSYAYGVTHFDGWTWTLFDNNILPGLTKSGEEKFCSPIVYNPTTEMIITGHGDDWTSGWNGLVMFQEDGYLKQSQYRIGTFFSGSWNWATALPLVRGFTDYEASICLDPDEFGLYAFWVSMGDNEWSIKWDKEQPEFDLCPFIEAGDGIERSASVDPHSSNWDSELSFSVSLGHLFDTSNSSSLLRKFLAKGRLIKIQFGERIAQTNFYEPVQTFTVSQDGEVVYHRDKMPSMKVQCETPRRRWEQIHIVASVYYGTYVNDAYPEDIIEDLLTTYANIPASQISLGTWIGRTTLNYQWVDVSLADAVDQIAFHFGYAIRIGAAGIVEAFRISNAETVDITYTDNVMIEKATPKNANSSFVNQWTVQCEERTFQEMLMAEELCAELNASHRWNTGSKTYRVQYTQGNKIFRNPRLEVVDSVESLGFEISGGCSEELIDNSHLEADPNLWDTYCEIEVDSPDLTPILIAGLIMVPMNALIGDYVIVGGFVASAGWTRPVGSFITALGIMICLNVLGSTGNFYYRVYGQPVVKVRRVVSVTVNDFDLQNEMGQVIPAGALDDPLCESSGDCLLMAEKLKMIGMGERKRWYGEKVPDLRNQEGDTITVIHPESKDPVTVFITDFTMIYTMPESSEDSGVYQNQFEGWRR